VELLHADQVVPEPGERVFRHGRVGPLVLVAIVAAPLCAAVALSGRVADAARELPWPAWILVAPFGLLGGLLYLVCLSAVAQVARRAWLPSNWSVRIAPGRILLNVRSFQNAHFAHDGPTVVRLELREIARAREVRDVTPLHGRAGPVVRAHWLELELAGADTTVLERIVRAERERPGPETRFLGIRSRTRFRHVPLHVAAPGVLRVEWLGRALPRALAAAGVALAARHDLDLAQTHGPDLDARLAELVRRGDRMAAITLARTELGLSLRETRDLVERMGREAA
jgi:hypothetical protein